jgi:hypothetical protein
LCIETLALPCEDAALLRDRLDQWVEYYKPETPGEFELIEIAVTSSVQRRRGLKYQAATLSKRVRNAEQRWDREREDEVARLRNMLRQQPAEAMAGLRRSGLGLRWVIGRWERLGKLLERDATWYGEDRNEAIRFLGHKAYTNCLRDSEEAYKVWLGCLIAQPRPSQAKLDELGLPEMMPASLHDRDDPEVYFAPSQPDCQRLLRELVQRELAPLRALEEEIRVKYDEPDRAEAIDRALVLDDAEGAKLLRYERKHELAFHRAYDAFLKGRKEAARTGLPPGAPSGADAAEEQDARPAEGTTSRTDRAPVVAPPDPGGEVSARQRTLAQAFAPNEPNAHKRLHAMYSVSSTSVTDAGADAGQGGMAQAGPDGVGQVVEVEVGAPTAANP